MCARSAERYHSVQGDQSARGDHSALAKELSRLDGKGYKAYKDLAGAWSLGIKTPRGGRVCVLYIDHVQGDPYAAPSRMRLRWSREAVGIPGSATDGAVRTVALEDYLTRMADRAGRKTDARVDVGAQEVLPRTSCVVTGEIVELRLAANLPAAGRRIKGREAHDLLLNDLPEVAGALLWEAQDEDALWRHLQAVEDQAALRSQLIERGLVAFVGEGAILPRASGVSDKPLEEGETPVVPFEVPKELAVTLDAPHAGSVKGMSIPVGVTMIVGGGFHGKSTLLRAIERGVYDHVPGDGREQVVTDRKAAKIRAEDGRAVTGVDISPFIDRLPLGKGTTEFTTPNSSGSTSQAANIMEALELGATALLIDEDTSATNFMVRDHIMRRLIPAEREPITPFIDQVRHLASAGVSTVLVMGGAGEYLRVADTVIAMETYRPRVATEQSRDLLDELGVGPHPGLDSELRAAGRPEGRWIVSTSIDPYRGRKRKIKLRGVDRIQFGGDELELGALEQLVDPSQARAVSEALVALREDGYLDGNALPEAVDALMAKVESDGLDCLSPYGGPPDRHPGDFALPRGLEVGAALNRLRALKTKS